MAKAQDLAGCEGLACAILYQAVKDARRGNGQALDAQAFLASPWAVDLLTGLNRALDTEYSPADLRALAGEGAETKAS